MKYFAIFEINIERIFQLQWKNENISDMFLQYSALCGNVQGVNKIMCRYLASKFASSRLVEIIPDHGPAKLTLTLKFQVNFFSQLL